MNSSKNWNLRTKAWTWGECDIWLYAEQEVGVHVEAYLYGEGETVRATPEEVAYFTMRADADEEFLHDHCDNIEDTDFTIRWSPDELYGTEMEL